MSTRTPTSPLWLDNAFSECPTMRSGLRLRRERRRWWDGLLSTAIAKPIATRQELRIRKELGGRPGPWAYERGSDRGNHQIAHAPNVTVEFDCSDALSGTSVEPQFVPVTAEGISSVKRSCTDNAGNSGTGAAVVGIEKTPANITATVLPATLAVAQTSVTVTLAGTFTGGPSGVDPSSFGATFVDPARRETVLPCAISSEGNYKCDVTLRPSAVGDYVFLVKARSKAGNSDVATATLTVK